MKVSGEKDFAKHLSAQEIYGTYLLYGSQTYLIRQYRDALVKKAVGSLEEPMNLHQFEEEGFDLERFYNAVESLPFFAEHRCVTLDLYGEKLDKATAEEIGKILTDVPTTTTVIVSLPGENVKKEILTPILKGCNKQGAVIELKERTRTDMLRFLRNRASKGGCQMSSDVAGYLMERCGTDMLRLAGEVDKLCAYCQQGEITKDHVREVAAPVLSARVFDLSKSILNGKTDGAMWIVDALRRQREPAPMVMSVLCGAFTDLYRGDALRRKGISLAEGAAALHYPKQREFALKYAVNDSQKVPKHLFAALLDTLADGDRRLKSTGADPWQVVEETVLRLLILLGRG